MIFIRFHTVYKILINNNLRKTKWPKTMYKHTTILVKSFLLLPENEMKAYCKKRIKY